MVPQSFRRAFLVLLFVSMNLAALCQERAQVEVTVHSGGEAVAHAVVLVGAERHPTDEQGKLSLSIVSGETVLRVQAAGFVPQSARLVAEPGQFVTVNFELVKVAEENITVSATRTDAGLEDLATRVEVLPAEEIEEKVSMTPGDIAMMLNEMGGLRVQATSPALGAANVRVQGMHGRYTRFLSDGLPLFGQQVGGLGILQIPPMDLGQVEVIKGVSSALYGAGAMGGVVNLVARQPGDGRKGDFLFNQSTLGATDGVFFGSAPLRSGWSGTLLAGGHFQIKNDIDGDGWADLAGYQRGVLRPRLYWSNHAGTDVFLTGGFSYENRRGGTTDGHVVPAAGSAYRESLESRNFDVGAKVQTLIDGRYLVGFRFATAVRGHRHVFGEILERDTHRSIFTEATVRTARGRHVLVAGVAFEADDYIPREVPRFRYAHRVPGVFLQDDFDVAPWLTLSLSGRVDHHNVHGIFLSPRAAVLVRGGGWSGRLAMGQGFSPATPLVEETEAAGLFRLTQTRPLRAERGKNFTFDLTKKAGLTSSTVTIFASRVNDPIAVDRNAYAIANLSRPTLNRGVEALFSVRPEDFIITAYYNYVRATESEGGARREVPLTPRHSAGFDVMWEREKQFRIGLELYYTGRQRLEADPYRAHSRSYVLVGLLLEKWFGPVRAFINAENLNGFRQTDVAPLLRPSRAVDGRWTVDAWAPLEGRVFNGGVRFNF